MKSYLVLLALFGVFITSPVLADDPEDDGSLDLKEGASGGEDGLLLASVRHVLPPPKCPNTYYPFPTKSCPKPRPGACRTYYCKNVIEFAYSKCDYIPLKLKNPIYHTARGCKYENSDCSARKYDRCFCKTIYCRKLLWRYVIIHGKPYRMRVYVRYPCSCRCATHKY